MFKLKKLRTPLAVLFGITIPLFLQGCINIFDPLDSPSGEAQLLSAARACFDDGDFACAREFYGKLGSNEDAIAELAFVKLDEQGAGIGSYVLALDAARNASSGMILTVLAEHMANGAGATKRAQILSAYQASNSITKTSLKGFVQFMAGLALAAEIIAELDGAQADFTVQKQTDIVANTSACRALSAVTCGNAVCANTSGYAWLGTNAVNLSTDTSVAKDWDTFQAAINAVNTGLTNMGVSNSTSQAVSLISSLLGVLGAGGDARCMQWALVNTSVDVGR